MAARDTQEVIEVVLLFQPAGVLTQDIIEYVVGLGIFCGNPPGGRVSVPYSHTFPAGAGEPPYTFAITAGALPDGLTLNPATAEVTGTPTAPGTFTFTVTVTDSFTITNSVSCSITVLGAFRIALYGWKRFKNRPVCAPDLVEVPEVPAPPRVL